MNAEVNDMKLAPTRRLLTQPLNSAAVGYKLSPTACVV